MLVCCLDVKQPDLTNRYTSMLLGHKATNQPISTPGTASIAPADVAREVPCANHVQNAAGAYHVQRAIWYVERRNSFSCVEHEHSITCGVVRGLVCSDNMGDM